MVVTKITPLYLILTLDSIETNSLATNELAARLCDQRGTPGGGRARTTGQAAALCVGWGKIDDTFIIPQWRVRWTIRRNCN